MVVADGGLWNENVRELQQALNDLGADPALAVNGIISNTTILDLQRAVNLLGGSVREDGGLGNDAIRELQLAVNGLSGGGVTPVDPGAAWSDFYMRDLGDSLTEDDGGTTRLMEWSQVSGTINTTPAHAGVYYSTYAQSGRGFVVSSDGDGTVVSSTYAGDEAMTHEAFTISGDFAEGFTLIEQFKGAGPGNFGIQTNFGGPWNYVQLYDEGALGYIISGLSGNTEHDHVDDTGPGVSWLQTQWWDPDTEDSGFHIDGPETAPQTAFGLGEMSLGYPLGFGNYSSGGYATDTDHVRKILFNKVLTAGERLFVRQMLHDLSEGTAYAFELRDEEPIPIPATISGVVIDKDAVPYEGAQIMLDGVSVATTEADGSYTATVSEGSFQFLVTTIGSDPRGNDTYVLDDDSTSYTPDGLLTIAGDRVIDVQLLPPVPLTPGTVSGSVTGLGEPIEGATVQLLESDGTTVIDSVLTIADGTFSGLTEADGFDHDDRYIRVVDAPSPWGVGYKRHESVQGGPADTLVRAGQVFTVASGDVNHGEIDLPIDVSLVAAVDPNTLDISHEWDPRDDTSYDLDGGGHVTVCRDRVGSWDVTLTNDFWNIGDGTGPTVDQDSDGQDLFVFTTGASLGNASVSGDPRVVIVVVDVDYDVKRVNGDELLAVGTNTDGHVRNIAYQQFGQHAIWNNEVAGYLWRNEACYASRPDPATIRAVFVVGDGDDGNLDHLHMNEAPQAFSIGRTGGGGPAEQPHPLTNEALRMVNVIDSGPPTPWKGRFRYAAMLDTAADPFTAAGIVKFLLAEFPDAEPF